MNPVRRAPFVVLEGLDGVGKTAVAAVLAARLDAALLSTPPRALAGVRPIVDSALDTSPLGRVLFYVATVAAASDEARRLVESGRPVILDRYWLSTAAYARADGIRLHLHAIERELLPADFTVLLVADRRVRLARLAGRGTTAADRRTADRRHERRVAAAYRDLLDHPVAGRSRVVDTTVALPEAVASEIAAALDGLAGPASGGGARREERA